jgi:hypothetical protein
MPAAERPAADAAARRPDAPPAPAAPPPAPAREAAPLPPAPPRKRAERLRDQRAAPAKAAAGPAPSPDWEECQVSLSFDAGDEHHFLAAPATGDPVARSPVFTAHRTSTVMESAEAREALQALVTSLLEDGWQLVGRDGDPWALRFRRRVRAPVTTVRHPAGR